NMVLLLFKPALWYKPKMIPVLMFSLFDCISSYLMPTTAAILMCNPLPSLSFLIFLVAILWDDFFQWLEAQPEFHSVGLEGDIVVMWWILFQIAILTLSTSLDVSDMFFMFNTFFSSSLMVVSGYYLITEQMWTIVSNTDINDVHSL